MASNPWSVAERVAHRALQDAGITGWVANPRVQVNGGERFPDVAFDDAKLAVEIDGRVAHDAKGAFDLHRHNQFVQAGWVVLHFTAGAVQRTPRRFVAEVAAALARLRAELDPPCKTTAAGSRLDAGTD